MVCLAACLVGWVSQAKPNRRFGAALTGGFRLAHPPYSFMDV